MRLRNAVLAVYILGTTFPLPSPAQSPSSPSPQWLEISAELAARTDFQFDPYQSRDDRLYLNRLRLKTTVRPSGWLKFVFEGQDARAFRLNSGPASEELRNTFDVHRGYLELGDSGHGFRVRLGRQELSFGDERLVGADNYWDAFGQSFDAARISLVQEWFQVEAFTGFRVQPAHRRPDPFDTVSRISGLSARLEVGGGRVLEPYLLWKRGSDTRDLLSHPGHRDVVTEGLRAQGDLPRGFDYNIEVALQRGHVVKDRISAWAGHWELGWKLMEGDLGPRLGLEYNFASGDNNPGDGRYQTFDDLYPAGFNKFGITDPYAWRNIRYPAVGVDVPIARRWTISSGYRVYWLATVLDGLYPGGDQFLVRHSGAGSSYIGAQAFISSAYVHSERWRLHGGYGHSIPGEYLRRSNCSSALRTAYLFTSFTF